MTGDGQHHQEPQKQYHTMSYSVLESTDHNEDLEMETVIDNDGEREDEFEETTNENDDMNKTLCYNCRNVISIGSNEGDKNDEIMMNILQRLDNAGSSLPQYNTDGTLMMDNTNIITGGNIKKPIRKDYFLNIFLMLVLLLGILVAIDVGISRNHQKSIRGDYDENNIDSSDLNDVLPAADVVVDVPVAPDHLADICSIQSIKTEDGHTACHDMCDAAQCCMAIEERINCIERHKSECASYSPCIILKKHNNDQHNDEDDYGEHFTAPVNNGSTELLSSSWFKPLGNNGIMVIPPPPSTLPKLCSSEVVSSIDGFVICSAICFFSQCCTFHSSSTTHYNVAGSANCYQQNVETCNEYHTACKNLSEGTAPHDDPDTLQDESKAAGVYAPVQTSIKEVCSEQYLNEKGNRDCEVVCSPRACCFTEGVENCRDLDPAWCDEYSRCKVLDEYGGIHDVEQMQGTVEQLGEQEVVANMNVDKEQMEIEEESYANAMIFEDSSSSSNSSEIFQDMLDSPDMGNDVKLTLEGLASTISPLGEKCSTNNLRTEEGRNECEVACYPRACCFANTTGSNDEKEEENCYSSKMVWCDEYKDCRALAELKANSGEVEFDIAAVSLDSSSDNNDNKNVSNDAIAQNADKVGDLCLRQNLLNPIGLQTCEDICSPSFCCFSLEHNCELNKAYMCNAYSACEGMFLLKILMGSSDNAEDEEQQQLVRNDDARDDVAEVKYDDQKQEEEVVFISSETKTKIDLTDLENYVAEEDDSELMSTVQENVIVQTPSLSPSTLRIKDMYSTTSSTTVISIAATYQKPDPTKDCQGVVTETPQSLSRCFIACEEYMCCFEDNDRQQNNSVSNCALDETKQCEANGICRFMAVYNGDRSKIILPPENLDVLCSSSNEKSNIDENYISDVAGSDNVAAAGWCDKACLVAECCYKNKFGTPESSDDVLRKDCSVDFCKNFSPCNMHWKKQTNEEQTMPPTIAETSATIISPATGISVLSVDVITHFYTAPTEVDCADENEDMGDDYLTREQLISRCFIACQDYICCFQGGSQNCAADATKECANHGACQHLATLHRSDVVLPPEDLATICGGDANGKYLFCGLACQPASCCLDPPEALDDSSCSREFCNSFQPCKMYWSIHGILDADVAATFTENVIFVDGSGIGDNIGTTTAATSSGDATTGISTVNGVTLVDNGNVVIEEGVAISQP